MLTPSQIEYADRSFGIYDHDWRYYSEFIGEPFLYNDCLHYFDGSILFCCAFPLSNPRKKITFADFEREYASFPYIENVRGVVFWGECPDSPDQLEFSTKHLKAAIRWNESATKDIVLDLEDFSFEKNRAARLDRNSARNKGIQPCVKKLDRLGWEHIALVEQFFNTHKITKFFSSYSLVLPSYIKCEHVNVVEGRLNGQLKGFAVVSLPNKETASMTLGFYDLTGRSGAADGVYAHVIEWLKELGVKKLHIGYSATESLLNFKKKWGKTIEGPSYWRVGYAHDAKMYEFLKMNEGWIWRDRIFRGVMDGSPII